MNTLNQTERHISNINSNIPDNSNPFLLQRYRLLLGQVLYKISSIYVQSVSPLNITSHTLTNEHIPQDAITNLQNALNDISKISKLGSDVIKEFEQINNTSQPINVPNIINETQPSRPVFKYFILGCYTKSIWKFIRKYTTKCYKSIIR